VFVITIYGVPTKEAADNFWSEIEQYKVNFLVLDRCCYIYGNTNDVVEDTLVNKAQDLGFAITYKGGDRNDRNSC
jgi:hypothetical protein